MKSCNGARVHQGITTLLGWYVIAGVVHEMFHLVAAAIIKNSFFGVTKNLHVFLLQAVLGRYCQFDCMVDAATWEIDVVRRAGWILSVVVAVILVANRKSDRLSPQVMAFSVTALEAVFADLLGIGVLRNATTTTFFCGNFGIILLSPSAWDGTTVLDLLQKMIEVTMMRGAQTGGVVAWKSNTNRNKGLRSRVVAGKRTDLSRDLRRKVQRQVMKGRGLLDSTTFYGHTRFATSSKATFDGTHPHQWSPPELRCVYPLDNRRLWTSIVPVPTTRKVENFITHNGDLDFYKIHGETVDLERLQIWLERATGHYMPASVDSAAIAGLVDLLRTAGCFGLSFRYAVLLEVHTGVDLTEESTSSLLPTYSYYEGVGQAFEQELANFCTSTKATLHNIRTDPGLRRAFAKQVFSKLKSSVYHSKGVFGHLWEDVEEGKGNLYQVTAVTIDAFFDNDLFQATKLLLRDAMGSFGLMITCSEDANRQVCIAARGQPMSIAFYPDRGLVCYGSEQAAVKAGLMFQPKVAAAVPKKAKKGSEISDSIASKVCRLDLDDLGGEVVLLDWSTPRMIGKPIVTVHTHQESKTIKSEVHDRITPLENNDLLLPLPKQSDDPILDELREIPRILSNIQQEWHTGGFNRVTAWNLGRRVRERLTARAEGKIATHGGTIDILLTGCEVSLWLAEQFASDLQKAFPRLSIRAVSSNKILGVFGQELAVPAVGFPLSESTPDLKDAIVIIVSHSGGTFGPLAISNLLQSVTRSIFVVSSEWDTQIGKQLRSMYNDDDEMFSSRVFTTNVGVRPAEPCSLSVAATHQLLTQILEYISLLILRDPSIRHFSGAVITETDLSQLERCNQDNILAMKQIVGKETPEGHVTTETERQLREAGDLWANHVLENARAYIMTFIYIVVTVTIGFPLISGIATASGLTNEFFFYLTRFFDSLIYFFLPQINVLIIRLCQGRNLRHRMVGRTVIIGDVPWVAQAGDAFLSKIFARSYSIAGLNVLHGNPADHLVHRHTHRIVRGSLLICGRPDGRLTALTSSECAVNLSVNQASSIQSIGGTCEAITIGHDPWELSLTKKDIFLPDFRPKFLCEKIVGAVDDEVERKQAALKTRAKRMGRDDDNVTGDNNTIFAKFFRKLKGEKNDTVELNRSVHSLKGLYLDMQGKSTSRKQNGDTDSLSSSDTLPIEFLVLEDMIQENEGTSQLRMLFNTLDADGSGEIDLDEFIQGYQTVKPGMPRETLKEIFEDADTDGNGVLDFDEFVEVLRMPEVAIIRTMQHSGARDERGLLQVEASQEDYFGEDLRCSSPSAVGNFAQSQSQHFSQELYESRVASLQRFVSMCVMFHQMGKRVQEFFPRISFGYLGYRMDRTHNIMRIATTASPVSGDAVRERMETLRLRTTIQHAVHVIAGAWCRYQTREIEALRAERRGLLENSRSSSARPLERSPSKSARSLGSTPSKRARSLATLRSKSARSLENSTSKSTHSRATLCSKSARSLESNSQKALQRASRSSRSLSAAVGEDDDDETDC